LIGAQSAKSAMSVHQNRKDQIMRDEIDSRIWNEHHEAFSASIAVAIDKLHAVFKQLYCHNFSAPWDESCNSGR
jgi:hypothetical protein